MPSPNTSLVDREDLRHRIDGRLAEVLADQSRILAEISADAAPLVDAWGRMLRGGKRLRAAFCYWSWRSHGAPADSPELTNIIGVGAALELFQAAALFHDDVMDKSDTRRGEPTAHRAFARRHVDAGWPGDAEQFGLSSAILLGDLSLISSEEEFLRSVSTVPDERAAPARDIFTRMRTEVTVGQYLDIHAQMQPWDDDFVSDERRAREIIRSKTARYSIECPMTLGATLAGATPEQVVACSAVGIPLGEAFQLRDDLLGVFGDPSTTGKPAGDDLREGKRTLLMIRTMRALDPAGRTELAAALGRTDLSDGEVAQIQEVVRTSGAVDEIEELITSLSTQAFDALEAAHLPAPAADTLVALARSAVERHA